MLPIHVPLNALLELGTMPMFVVAVVLQVQPCHRHHRNHQRGTQVNGASRLSIAATATTDTICSPCSTGTWATDGIGSGNNCEQGWLSDNTASNGGMTVASRSCSSVVISTLKRSHQLLSQQVAPLNTAGRRTSLRTSLSMPSHLADNLSATFQFVDELLLGVSPSEWSFVVAYNRFEKLDFSSVAFAVGANVNLSLAGSLAPFGNIK